MSFTNQKSGATAPTLLQTIATDLAAIPGWLESEATAIATQAWDDFRLLFQAVTAEEYANFKDIVEQLSTDETSNMGVEATVADVLSYASANQLGWIATLPSQVLNALTALAKQSLGLTV
ncbi:MAG TPA: hypothetical protein VII49_01700 [Rhizomicrobium sp.]